jgi:hypothetical protein
MTVRCEFERDAGFRFSKGNISLLLHAVARFRQTAVVTNYDHFNFFKATNKFLQSVGAYDREQTLPGALLQPNHFPDLEDAQFYKFVREQDLAYYNEGSFQFGSIQYYRAIEHQSSKDAMEGLANVAIKTPSHLFGMSLASGYNFGIFCGTADLRQQDEMSAKFGPRIIRIANLRAFAEETKALLGARRFYFNRVVYDDLKIFRVETLKSIDLDQPLISDAVFDLLYDNSFLPSLFMKPTRFAVEEELRLVFEMADDVPKVLPLIDKNLSKRIELIH